MIARRDFTAAARSSVSVPQADSPRAIGSMLGAVLARYGVTYAARVQVVHSPHAGNVPHTSRFAPLSQGRLF
ncbi:MAG: hypothetical protein QM811_21695 [Pirellulales bacterium]